MSRPVRQAEPNAGRPVPAPRVRAAPVRPEPGGDRARRFAPPGHG
ncbi:hypothetical protein [Glycomyces amatae]|nr:hypothetical protein [Glycomyces amatae]